MVLHQRSFTPSLARQESLAGYLVRPGVGWRDRGHAVGRDGRYPSRAVDSRGSQCGAAGAGGPDGVSDGGVVR